MSRYIRRLVSQSRRRIHEDGFDLDLSYITPRMVAMSFPATGREALYRNRAKDVRNFLDQRHGSKYRVVNFCAEKSYDPSLFRGQVEVYPIEDHNVPSLEMMLDFCERSHNWQCLDDQNVLVLHCKAGKGRTGMMACAYLIYTGQCASMQEAVQLYNEARTLDGDGLTIPSQIRYLSYFSNLCQLSSQDFQTISIPQPRKISRLEFRMDLPGIQDVSVKLSIRDSVYHAASRLVAFCSTCNSKKHQPFGFGRIRRTQDIVDVMFELDHGSCLQGDLKVHVFDKSLIDKGSVFWFWINTGLVEGHEILLTKSSLDKVAKKYSHAHLGLSVKLVDADQEVDPFLDEGSQSCSTSSTGSHQEGETEDAMSCSKKDVNNLREPLSVVQEQENGHGRSSIQAIKTILQSMVERKQSTSIQSNRKLRDCPLSRIGAHESGHTLLAGDAASPLACFQRLEGGYRWFRQIRSSNMAMLEQMLGTRGGCQQVTATS